MMTIMRIRNISKTVVNVAGLSIAPHRVAEINPNHFQSWNRGSANAQVAATSLEILDDAVPEVEVAETEDTIEKLVRIIGELDPDNKEHWTTGGKPDVNALRSISGIRVTGAQRDTAFDQHLEVTQFNELAADTDLTGDADADADSG